jgi:pimeloyl-ACP methyl ester carboxylesterase
MASHPPIEGRIRLRCGRAIGFAEYGDPAGKPIFWFPGTPGGRGQIPPEARAFAAGRGIRLVALERPGIGGSTPHVYPSLLGWAHDVEEIADRLDIDRFGLIGLSGGGPYVLACAYQLEQRVTTGAVLGGVAPTRGDDSCAGGLVALAVTLAPVLEGAREPLGHVLWGLVRSLAPFSSLVFDRFIEFMPEGDRTVFRRPGMKSMFIDDLNRASHEQLVGPIYDLLQFTRPWGFSLRNIRVPIRFWHGDADNIVPLAHAERMAALVPDSELRIRPGEGHIGNLAASQEILEVLLALWPIAECSARSEDGNRGGHGRDDAHGGRGLDPLGAPAARAEGHAPSSGESRDEATFSA